MYSMSIIEKVFHYEENEISVIFCHLVYVKNILPRDNSILIYLQNNLKSAFPG